MAMPILFVLPLSDVCDDSPAEYHDPCADHSDVCHLTVDLLGTAVTGLRTVHHNVQGTNSKLLKLSQWFEASENSNTV